MAGEDELIAFTILEDELVTHVGQVPVPEAKRALPLFRTRRARVWDGEGTRDPEPGEDVSSYPVRGISNHAALLIKLGEAPPPEEPRPPAPSGKLEVRFFLVFPSRDAAEAMRRRVGGEVSEAGDGTCGLAVDELVKPSRLVWRERMLGLRARRHGGYVDGNEVRVG